MDAEMLGRSGTEEPQPDASEVGPGHLLVPGAAPGAHAPHGLEGGFSQDQLM